MKSGKVFLSILVGATAGALVGILFAPAKGSKTRKKILRTGEDYIASVNKKIDDLFDDVSKKYERIKEDVSEYVEKTIKS